MPPKANRPSRSATAPKPSAKDKRRQELARLQHAGDKARAAFEYTEANQHYDAALALGGSNKRLLTPAHEFDLRAGRAACYRRIGNSEAASADYEAMAKLAKTAGDRPHEIEALNSLAQAVINRGDFGVAERKAKTALRLARALGDRKLEADGLISLSEWKRAVGEPGEAQALLEKSLELFRQLDDRAGQASSLRRLGRLSIAIGEPARSHGYLNEALLLYP